MNKKLDDISNTWRLCYHSRIKGIGADKVALSILSKIDEKGLLVKGVDALVVRRTKIIDEYVIEFLKENPNSKIVNFGCGMCTRFWRIDNGKIQWTNIDFSKIIEIRKELLPKCERVQDIAMNLSDGFDSSNFDLIIAEGVMPFLKTEIGLSLLQKRTIFDLPVKKYGYIQWNWKPKQNLKGLDIIKVWTFGNMIRPQHVLLVELKPC